MDFTLDIQVHMLSTNWAQIWNQEIILHQENIFIIIYHGYLPISGTLQAIENTGDK
jgi:hypothetical protein